MNTNEIEGISVITSTIRKSYANQVVSNFMRQKFKNKELIIVINNDEMQPSDFKLSKHMKDMIHIYQMPASEMLGQCLNMGAEKAKYKYIAKFDDDDYYSTLYLQEMYGAFKREGCEVVCKRGIFYYLEGFGEIVLLSPGSQNKYVTKGAGATIGARKDIFNKIQFENVKKGKLILIFLKDVCNTDLDVIAHQVIIIYVLGESSWGSIRGRLQKKRLRIVPKDFFVKQ